MLIREDMWGKTFGYQFGDYRFTIRLWKYPNNQKMCAIECYSIDMLNVTVVFESQNAQNPPITSNFILMPKSTKQYQLLPGYNNLKIIKAEVVELPFIVSKRAEALISPNFCNLFIGDDVISVGVEAFHKLPESKSRLMLDENQCIEIENVDFTVFLEFFKFLFAIIPQPDQRAFCDVETCRKLVEIYQRYSTERFNTIWETRIQMFYMADFYSATNMFCVVAKPEAVANREYPRASSPQIWSNSFIVKYGENNKEKLFKVFEMFDVHLRFYICKEKINNVEYLGIGMIINPSDTFSDHPYWSQPAEIEVTVKASASKFLRKLKFSREFNHYQSSVGCPVVARLDEICSNQDDHLIFDIQVRNESTCVVEFFGENDITLVVEDKKIITSKNLLIHHFDYFKTLFESNFDDKNQKELVLYDVKYEDMYNIMDVIYNRSKSLTVNNLERMLILADRFFCPFIFKYADIAISDMPVSWRTRAEIPISIDVNKYFAEKYTQLVCVKEEVRRAANTSKQSRNRQQHIEILA